jgi:hypothetical protein
MPGFKSNYLANQINDAVHGAVAYTAPATLYFALFTVTPTATGGGTEVTGGSYARVAVTNNLTNFPSSSGGVKKNGASVTFAAPTADWGVCTALVEFDASSGGNMITVEIFATPVTVLNGSPALVLPINSITYTEA